jgi:metal-responsive CopG/Arc/MetJ family transcriptional regulator
MEKAIGVRLPQKLLQQIEKLSDEECEDRSTIIRKLLMIGYLEFIRKKVAEDYLAGRITFSEAARRAKLTLWEMEQYLIEKGFKSTYSIKDLENELKALVSYR